MWTLTKQAKLHPFRKKPAYAVCKICSVFHDPSLDHNYVLALPSACRTPTQSCLHPVLRKERPDDDEASSPALVKIVCGVESAADDGHAEILVKVDWLWVQVWCRGWWGGGQSRGSWWIMPGRFEESDSSAG
jgi:hypothetical protein